MQDFYDFIDNKTKKQLLISDFRLNQFFENLECIPFDDYWNEAEGLMLEGNYNSSEELMLQLEGLMDWYKRNFSNASDYRLLKNYISELNGYKNELTSLNPKDPQYQQVQKFIQMTTEDIQKLKKE